MSCYILLNPDLIIQITKLHSKLKITKKDDSQFTDLSNQLYEMMEQQKYYLIANYNLTNLSSDTDISVKTIREIISNSDFKNFSTFINSFRIAHAEQLIYNSYLDTYSIESLCKDSGFQSEVTFYRVFKKIHNCTPKEFSYRLKSHG
jgi:AraC-like DNA-binding protein